MERGLNVTNPRGHPYLPFKKGYYFHADEHSRYQGLYVRKESSMFKLLDSIDFDTAINTVQRDHDGLHLHTDTSKLTLSVDDGVLAIRSSTAMTATVVVDMRYIHDFDDTGRIYQVSDQGRIQYTKYESSTCRNVDYTEGLRVDAATWRSIQDWAPRNYEFDNARQTRSDLWVYRAGEATILPDRPLRICHEALQQSTQPMDRFLFDDGRTRVAAGYPWFYEAWSRDEVITAAAFLEDKPKLARDIVVGAAKHKTHDESVPGSQLGSADTPGWIGRRAGQLLDKDILSDSDHDVIRDYLDDYVTGQRLRRGLVHNDGLTTWMDTDGGTADDRSGARVEIQAGMLAALDTLSRLSSDDSYVDTYRQVRSAVQDRLVTQGVLRDGFDDGVDATPRPNVFLAYYLHPGMVAPSTWRATFDHVLDECWLDWGGLSSVARSHELFEPLHTGSDNRSYHRGDSWYWVNNVAAMVLHDLRPHRYLRYVERIRRASRRDFEEIGAVGACSEISSAERQESWGCFDQAWSLATFEELRRRLQG